MTAIEASASTLNWETVARASAHPTQIAILELLHVVHDRSDPARSPTDLAAVLDAPLGVVAYHVRMLAGRGLIRETRTVPVRGALQHYYALTEETTS